MAERVVPTTAGWWWAEYTWRGYKPQNRCVELRLTGNNDLQVEIIRKLHLSPDDERLVLGVPDDPFGGEEIPAVRFICPAPGPEAREALVALAESARTWAARSAQHGADKPAGLEPLLLVLNVSDGDYDDHVCMAMADALDALLTQP